MNLNQLMEFDHVVEVHADGSVTDAPESLYAPEVSVELDDDGQMVGSDDRDGVDVLAMDVSPWEFMHGYTGQQGSTSRSFIMHSSEYIGGRMKRDILAQPGFYVAVAVDGLLPEGSDNDEDTVVGWAVAFREAPK